jgi:hypothetical protein
MSGSSKGVIVENGALARSAGRIPKGADSPPASLEAIQAKSKGTAWTSVITTWVDLCLRGRIASLARALRRRIG